MVFVLKKNVNSLRAITLWLKQNCGQNDSLLLIDDEADNASINVSYSKDEISRINGQIRDILGIFQKSCYVGYTAKMCIRDSSVDVCGVSDVLHEVPSLAGLWFGLLLGLLGLLVLLIAFVGSLLRPAAGKQQ